MNVIGLHSLLTKCIVILLASQAVGQSTNKLSRTKNTTTNFHDSFFLQDLKRGDRQAVQDFLHYHTFLDTPVDILRQIFHVIPQDSTNQVQDFSDVARRLVLLNDRFRQTGGNTEPTVDQKMQMVNANINQAILRRLQTDHGAFRTGPGFITALNNEISNQKQQTLPRGSGVRSSNTDVIRTEIDQSRQGTLANGLDSRGLMLPLNNDIVVRKSGMFSGPQTNINEDMTRKNSRNQGEFRPTGDLLPDDDRVMQFIDDILARESDGNTNSRTTDANISFKMNFPQIVSDNGTATRGQVETKTKQPVTMVDNFNQDVNGLSNNPVSSLNDLNNVNRLTPINDIKSAESHEPAPGITNITPIDNTRTGNFVTLKPELGLNLPNTILNGPNAKKPNMQPVIFGTDNTTVEKPINDIRPNTFIRQKTSTLMPQMNPNFDSFWTESKATERPQRPIRIKVLHWPEVTLQSTVTNKPVVSPIHPSIPRAVPTINSQLKPDLFQTTPVQWPNDIIKPIVIGLSLNGTNGTKLGPDMQINSKTPTNLDANMIVKELPTHKEFVTPTPLNNFVRPNLELVPALPTVNQNLGSGLHAGNVPEQTVTIWPIITSMNAGPVQDIKTVPIQRPILAQMKPKPTMNTENVPTNIHSTIPSMKTWRTADSNSGDFQRQRHFIQQTIPAPTASFMDTGPIQDTKTVPVQRPTLTQMKQKPFLNNENVPTNLELVTALPTVDKNLKIRQHVGNTHEQTMAMMPIITSLDSDPIQNTKIDQVQKPTLTQMKQKPLFNNDEIPVNVATPHSPVKTWTSADSNFKTVVKELQDLPTGFQRQHFIQQTTPAPTPSVNFMDTLTLSPEVADVTNDLVLDSVMSMTFDRLLNLWYGNALQSHDNFNTVPMPIVASSNAAGNEAVKLAENARQQMNSFLPNFRSLAEMPVLPSLLSNNKGNMKRKLYK